MGILLTGEVYNSLTVVRKSDKPKHYLFRCVCGTEKELRKEHVVSGSTKSCGCIRSANPLQTEMIGKTYNRLTVLRGSDRKTKEGRKQWVWCQCECGSPEIEVNAVGLRSENTKSCGCYKAERIRDTHKTHGMSSHPAYFSWQSAKKRCRTPSTEGYENYGGRGIIFSPLWDDFDVFWTEMGSTWEEGLSIDRIDMNGNYEPGNCKWSTFLEQQNNTTRNVFIDTPDGVMTIAQAARHQNIPYKTMYRQVDRLNNNR